MVTMGGLMASDDEDPDAAQPSEATNQHTAAPRRRLFGI
jgi:hypothetical protein